VKTILIYIKWDSVIYLKENEISIEARRKLTVHTPSPERDGIPLLDLESLGSLGSSNGTGACTASFTRRPCNHVNVFWCHLFFFSSFLPALSPPSSPRPFLRLHCLLLHSEVLPWTPPPTESGKKHSLGWNSAKRNFFFFFFFFSSTSATSPHSSYPSPRSKGRNRMISKP